MPAHAERSRELSEAFESAGPTRLAPGAAVTEEFNRAATYSAAGVPHSRSPRVRGKTPHLPANHEATMAGHSHFKNMMHRKGAQDAKRARQFARLIREITVAAGRGLPDTAFNPRLRAAVAAARQANMTRDTIERAIKKAAGEGGTDNYQEVRYEGYGPAGVAVIVEALTDNRNRTAGEIRSAFAKNGGALGETNSVGFMFNRVGAIRYPAAAGFGGCDAGSRDRSGSGKCRDR